MARLVGYLRCSTDEQAASGLGLEAQRHRIEAWCVAMGHELAYVVQDAGVSGTEAPDDRPGLGALLADLERPRRFREVEGVVALKLDRLGRSTRDLLDLVDRAERKGWRLATVSESLDTGTASGRFVTTILSALAQLERDVIAERTRAALQVLDSRRLPTGRFTPWTWRCADGGFEVRTGDKRPLVPHDEERELVQLMLDAREQGKSMAAIAAELESNGCTNPRTGENRWTARRVDKIISSVRRRAKAAG